MEERQWNDGNRTLQVLIMLLGRQSLKAEESVSWTGSLDPECGLWRAIVPAFQIDLFHLISVCLMLRLL